MDCPGAWELLWLVICPLVRKKRKGTEEESIDLEKALI